jgi:hypothetical protein
MWARHQDGGGVPTSGAFGLSSIRGGYEAGVRGQLTKNDARCSIVAVREPAQRRGEAAL